MNITQFFLLAIERNMISNKNGIEIFYTAFKEACGQDNDQLNNTKFYYAIVLLSKALFGHEENPFETMFSLMLVDQIMTNDMKLVGGRVPKMDEDTIEILSEEAIMVYISYLDQLKYLFTSFIHPNYNAGKKAINWREIEEKSYKMISRCFLKLARHKFLIPHMFNVEDLQQFLKATIPPMTGEEYHYFEDNEILRAYEEDKNYQTTLVEPFEGEPGLLFHEFIFLLGRIACNRINTSENISGKISDFFVEKLGLHRVESGKGMLTYEDITKKLYLSDDEGIFSDEEEEDGWDSEEEMDEQQKLFFEFLQKKAEEEKDFIIDYEQILNELEPFLPPIPPRPVVEQINPRPYKLPRILFGKLMPKKDGDDDPKKKKKEVKKPPQRKKDEPPPKPIKWADAPQKPEPNTLQLIRQARDNLVTNIFPNNIRGDQCNTGVAPCIIKEVFFPPDAPNEIATLIESSIVYQNTANYEMAVHSFEQGRDKWREILNVAKLRNEIELFFEMSLGSVYESCGKDDIALSCYMRAKKIQLAYNHPDQAFAYCGLGSVLYHMDEPAWSLKCYLKAREIREERLGGDTVDTATVYNNLGCCMYMLERNQEAKAYFELSEAILECELGPNHERTLTAGRNIIKANRTVLNVKPVFRQLWTTALPHPCPKRKKKKKKGKGGLDYVQDSAESAPLTKNFFDNNEKFSNFDTGVFDYVLKCIDGPYNSKFIYLNTATPEVIGGGSNYDIGKNPENITMFIEKQDLDDRHAEIVFQKQSCEYILKNVSEGGNSKGIWVKIPLDEEGINLGTNNNIKRKYMIGKYKYQFEFQEGSIGTEQVEAWLNANNMAFAIDMVKGQAISKLDDLFLLTHEMFNKYKISEANQTQLKNRLKELSNQFKPARGSPQYNLLESGRSLRQRLMNIIFTEGHEDVYQATAERPFTIGSRDKVYADIQLPDSDLSLELKVYFRNGTFYLKGTPQENVDQLQMQSAYFSLFPNEEIKLQPGMILVMGQLQFMVERFNVGVVADPGTRGNMEDTYVVNQDLQIDDKIKASLYAVIDGHGGGWCAVFLKTHLADELRRQLLDRNLGLFNFQGGLNECVTKAFQRTFMILDEQFYKEMSEISYKCGAAAVAVLILGNRVFCANVGDSRAALSRNGKAINLSVDQKANRQDEAERVIKNGGSISCGRVEQRLAITRAFGDYEFKYFKTPNGQQVKKNFITSEPEVRHIDLDYFQDEFIIIGSDGLYDKFSSQEAVTYTRTKLGSMQYMEQDTQRVARDITNESIYTRHVRDNVTVIIVAIIRGVKLSS